MSVSTVQLGLAIGQYVPSAVPRFMVEALTSAEISRSDNGPAAFQLSFNADRSPDQSSDYALLSSPLLKPSNRVVITVAVSGVPHVLMDGIITRQELSHSTESGAATLTITGEDISVIMDLVQYSFEYPGLGDSEIAAVILLKYGVLGVIPTVIPTLAGLISLPVERVPQQAASDRCFLQRTAAQHGYVFYVKPGPFFPTNFAYWGPPIRLGTTASALSIDLGPATNVETINFQYDALAPVLMAGLVQDAYTEFDVPVVTLGPGLTRQPPLARRPAIPGNLPFVHYQLYTETGVTAFQAYDSAQATTDQSLDQVVVVQGTLDSVRYGDVLDAPGLVAVRGAGDTYDGTYYVKSVSHKLRRGEYKQEFTLTREGVGSLLTEVQP